MTSSFFRSTVRPVGLAAALAALAAGCATPSSPSGSTAATSVSAASADAPTTPLVLDREVAAVGTAPAAVRAKITELLATLRQQGVGQQTRQNVCEQLGRILPSLSAGDPALAVLAPMLRDSAEVNLGRLALEPVPGAAVDAAFLDALARTTGPTRLALIQSLGTRRQAGAVPALAALLKDADATHAATAAHSLGQIGTAEALAALLAAPNPAAPVVVEARLSAAWNLPAAEGNTALRAVLADARIAPAQRAAALRGLLDREPADAATLIVEQLSGDNQVFKDVVLEAVASHPARDLSSALAAKLSSWDARTQQAVVTALGLRRDPAVLPAVTTALAHEDAGVRMAAMTALTRLPGSPELADRLARAAATAGGDEAATALASLARLDGPGVSAAIVARASEGEPGARRVYLEAVGLRNQTEALPLLFETRNDPDVDVRTAALGAVAELASADAQDALLEWTIAAADGREATRALRAFTSVSLRNPDLASRDRALVETIDRAEPAVQQRLASLLPRLPSPLTRASAARLVLGTDERVASAAFAQLQRWPDATVLPVYVEIAARTDRDAVRKTAIENTLRLLDQSRGSPAAEQSTVLAVLFGTTQDPALRRTLVAALGRGSSAFARAFVSGLEGDPELAAEVRHALASISANQKGAPDVEVSASAGQKDNLVDGRTQSQWRASLDADQWLQLDLHESRPLRQLTLDQTGRPGDYPTQYEVYVSDDPENLGAALVSGSGQRDRTVIELPAGTKGRHVRIVNREHRENAFWTVSEVFVD